MQIPGWLFPVTLMAGIVFAFLWLVSKVQRKELQALLARSGDTPTRGLSNTAGEVLNWRTLRSGEYYLCAQNDVLAKYTSTSSWHEARVEVEFKEGRWAIESNSLYSLPDKTLRATCKHDQWWGTYSITLANGRRFQWQRHGTAFGGFVGWRETTWFLVNDQHARLVRFKNTEVEVDQSTAAMPELPILVLFGSIYMIGILESDWGG